MLHPRERRSFLVRRAIQGVLAATVFMVALGFAWVDLGARPANAILASQPSKAAARPEQAERIPPTPAAALPVGRPIADLVVLVSLDGLRPDAITPGMRALHKLQAQGASPSYARTIDKSATLPSHASMVSGVEPKAHGLDFNAYKPDRGVIERPTVFSVTHSAGLPTAMFVGKAKLKHLLGRPSDAEFKMGGMLCDKLLKSALPYLQQADRGLVFLHFADTDSAGHRQGWMTKEYLEAAHTADRCLGRVIDTLEAAGRMDRTLLLVTSDHGGHNRSHGTRLDVDQRIPWYAWGAGVRRGRFARAVHTTDTAATVLAALGLDLPAGIHGRPVSEAFTRALGPVGMPILGKPVEGP